MAGAETKLCNKCGFEIPHFASVCHNCKLSQGWLGRIGSYQAAFAVVVAVGSMFTSTLAIWNSVQPLSDSDSELIKFVMEEKYYRVILVNNGDKPAVLYNSRIDLEFIDDDEIDFKDRNPDDVIIPSGVKQFIIDINFSMSPVRAREIASELRLIINSRKAHEGGEIYAEIIESNGILKDLHVPVHYADFEDILIKHAQYCERMESALRSSRGCL